MFRCFLFVITCLSLLYAATGTVRSATEYCLAGSTCPRVTTEPYPETGTWFNPEEPGSGFVFEIQNAYLAGYYFGYDLNGAPLWFLFSGQLQLESDGPATWVLNADLQQFSDGACINCAFTPPSDPVTTGTIQLEFFTRTQAKFSVDGGPSRRIQSFTFGSDGVAIIPGLDFRFPDLQGQWLVVVYEREAEIESADRRYAAFGRDLWLHRGELEEGHAFFGIFDFQSFPEAVQLGSLECVPQTSGAGGKCTVRIAQPPLAPKSYFMPVTGVSDTYFSAVAPDGDTIEGFRVNYD